MDTFELTSVGTSKLRDIFVALLCKRKTDSDYELLSPLFALFVFVSRNELGAPSVIKPFINKEGEPVSYSSKDKTAKLSLTAKKFLHDKSLSDFIQPPEESLICVSLGKYIMSLPAFDKEEYAEALKEDPKVIQISKFNPHGSSSSYTENDYRFYRSLCDYTKSFYASRDAVKKTGLPD